MEWGRARLLVAHIIQGIVCDCAVYLQEEGDVADVHNKIHPRASILAKLVQNDLLVLLAGSHDCLITVLDTHTLADDSARYPHPSRPYAHQYPTIRTVVTP